jgi:thiamine biosynthesis lipoprotein
VIDPAVEAPRPVSRFERRAMGSPLRLTLVGVSESRAAEAWTAASDAVEEIEQALSRFRPTSDLVALNRRAGNPERTPVARPLGRALAAASRAHRITGGAFDPRVLADLERLGYAGTPVDRSDAAGVGSTRVHGAPGDPVARPRFEDGAWLRLDPRRPAAAVAAPIDLGGIGKGLALRWAFGVLRATLPELDAGASGALLEAGGDLVATGLAPEAGSWLVGIESPLTNEEIAVLELGSGAVCTSSIGVHAWTTADGRAVHHLLDPRTGEPGGEGLVSVTVAGPDPAWAEVWSKSLFLEGTRGIGARARALGLAAWWIDGDGSMEMTPAARVRTAWVATEA